MNKGGTHRLTIEYKSFEKLKKKFCPPRAPYLSSWVKYQKTLRCYLYSYEVCFCQVSSNLAKYFLLNVFWVRKSGFTSTNMRHPVVFKIQSITKSIFIKFSCCYILKTIVSRRTFSITMLLKF